jgi:hypothetical protein
MRHALRIVLIATGIAVGGVLLAAGMGMTGAWDKYFTVRLVNRTAQTVVVDNNGDRVALNPGQIDPEWGSSTAHQPIRVLAGTVRTCVDLYLRRAPRRPLSIVISGHQLRVIGAPRC